MNKAPEHSQVPHSGAFLLLYAYCLVIRLGL